MVYSKVQMSKVSFSVFSFATKLTDHLFSSNLVERPSLFCGGYDLLRGQDEPVEAGVSQLNAVHIWDVGDTKGPVEGGARCSVEDARDAANLVVFPMDCMKGFIAIECKVIHCIIARSWRLSVAPWNKDELTVAVEGLVEDDPVLASSHPVSHVASFNLLSQRKYMCADSFAQLFESCC